MAPDLRAEELGDHIDRLFRAAWAMCGSREDAEDLVQETFTRVLSKRRRIDTDDPLPYLMRVLRNTYVSSLRTRSRRPRTTTLDDPEAALPEPAAPPSSSPLEALSTRELFAAIAALPDDQREVVVAVDVAGLEYAEAAAAFGIPVGTVMSRLYRARDKVASRLSERD